MGNGSDSLSLSLTRTCAHVRAHTLACLRKLRVRPPQLTDLPELPTCCETEIVAVSKIGRSNVGPDSARSIRAREGEVARRP